MSEQLDGRLLRSIETKEKILSSAIDIFIENGFEKTTIKQIITRAEIGYGSAYTHFKGKDEILIALMEDVMDRFFTIAELEYEPANLLDAQTRIQYQVSEFLRLAEQERSILRVFHEAMGRSETAKQKWKLIQKKFIERISKDISHVQDKGLAKSNLNIELVARSWFSINEMYLWELVENEDYPFEIEEIAENVTELYTKGLYV
ncbi:TetR/AcrR family transcriptional regulator [Bacillus sp. JJ1609]|uniref:TetR/AcrR family transcriptional regulator n=1 Tax=Bacillus sp. JJ1609 TaxID=3122977 RepID=UPI003000C591